MKSSWRSLLQVIARRRWLTSMRARLIAILVLVAILGGVPSVGSIFYLYQSNLHERLDSEFSTRNLVAAREIEIILDEIRGDLVVAASVPPVQGIVRARDGGGYDREGMSTYEEWVKRLQDIFISIETAYQRYPQIRFLDENGNELVRVNWDGTQARAIPPAELQNKADRPYFQETMKLAAGQVYVSRLDLNQESGRIVVPYQPTLRLATPIFNAQGQRRGIVIVNVLGDNAFLEKPQMMVSKEGSFTFITDQRGYYLHHSAAPEKEWGSPEDLNTAHSLWADFPQTAKQILSGQAGEIYESSWEIYYRPILIDRERGTFLVLGLALPVNVIQGLMNPLLLVFGGVIAFSLLLTLGAGYYFAGRITAPLETLRQGVRQIASGKFDQRVPVAGSAEVADLADDFNSMASQLQELYSSQQAEYRRIINASPAIVFLWRAAEGWPAEFVSDNVQQWGYTPEDFISGRIPFAKIVHPEDLERVAAEVSRYSEEGRTEFTQEYRIITKAGDVHWLDDRTWVRRDTMGS